MKKLLIYTAIIAALGLLVWLLFFKDSKGAKLFKYIPQTSEEVFLIDPMAIMEKGNLESFQNSAVWKEIMKNKKNDDASEAELMENIVKDPKSSGIDFSSYFVTYTSSENVGFLCAIDDQARFSEFAKKLPFGSKTEHRNGFNYKIHEFSTLLAWNDEVAIMSTLMGGAYNEEKLDEIFLKRVPSINHDAAFRKFAKRKADIASFKDYKKQLEKVDAMTGFISKLNIPTDFALATYINFENGKIMAEMSAIYRNKADEEKLKSLTSGQSINSLELIATHQPILFMNFKLDMKALFKLIEEGKDSKTFFKDITQTSGLSKEEFEKVFSGQISVSFLGMKTDSIERQGLFDDTVRKVKENIPMISLFVGINDKASAEKLIQNLPLVKTGNYYKMITPIMNISLVKSDKGFLVFTDESMAKEAAAKGKLSDGNFGEVSKMLTKYSTSGYLELDMKKVPAETRDFLNMALGHNAVIADSVLMRLDNFKTWSEDNGKTIMELNFKDQKKNALVQLLDIVNYVMLKQAEEEARQREMMLMFEEQVKQQMEEGKIEEMPAPEEAH